MDKVAKFTNNINSENFIISTKINAIATSLIIITVETYPGTIVYTCHGLFCH